MGHQIWAVGELSHLDDLMFCQKSLHETWCRSGHIVVMKLPITPIAADFWIILIDSVEECSSLMQNLVHGALLSHFECDDHTVHILNSIYTPHWLVQWSRHCSHMHIVVHCPWLPCYIDVVQAVLVTLTMALLFLDRPHRYNLQTYTFSFWFIYVAMMWYIQWKENNLSSLSGSCLSCDGGEAKKGKWHRWKGLECLEGTVIHADLSGPLMSMKAGQYLLAEFFSVNLGISWDQKGNGD